MSASEDDDGGGRGRRGRGGRGGGVEPLPGRGDEQDALRAALAAAIASEPSVVLVEGEAGIGKSALVRWLMATCAPSVRVLYASGEEAEQRLDLGIVEQLFNEAAALGLDVPMPFGRAGSRPDPFQVGSALLGLVGAAAADGPVLLVVDDAQWSDQPSLQALTFAARRIRRLSVLTVVVQRPGVPTLEPFRRLVADGRGSLLRLGGLSVSGLRELVASRLGVVLPPRAAERLHEHTRGNPLETIALADELDPEELRSSLGPLPAPKSYATLMLNRLAACDPAVEELVTAVAVLGHPVRVGVVAEMLGVDGGDAPADPAIEAAVQHGFLHMELRAGVTVLEVAHPLLRSAILYDLPPGQRAELHRRAAEVTADPIRRMLHRLAAATDEDPELGREAVGLASERLRHGWEMSAVELLTAARHRFDDRAQRDEAVLLAVDSLLAVGDTATAEELLAEVEPDDGHAYEQLLRGQLAFLQGRGLVAHAALHKAWAAEAHRTDTQKTGTQKTRIRGTGTHATEPDGSSLLPGDVAARTAMLLATLAANQARSDRALVWARRALAQEAPGGGDPGQALTMLASGWSLAGDLPSGLEEIARWRSAARLPEEERHALLPHGLLLLWSGELDAALVTFEEALATLSDATPLVAATIRYSLADTLYRLGEWDRAVDIAQQLATWLDDADLPLAAPMAHGVASFVLAGRGEHDEVDQHLQAATHALEAIENPSGLLWKTVAAARASAARGDHASVVGHLQPLSEITAHLQLPEGVQPWRADLIESLIALDRLDDAATELAALDARLTGSGAHAQATAARARGALALARGDAETASEIHADALTEAPERAGPFVRGRLELAAGAGERRRGRRREAAALLGAALDRFTALGATPYADLARRELDACGLTPRARDGSAESLTPAERNVAALVAAGRTNREVAAELVVSIKTVETHLGRVYAKLGVRSRSELAARWREGPDRATPDRAARDRAGLDRQDPEPRP